MMGRVVAVVGPSGAGKDTLLAGATRAEPALHWARRSITRPESGGGEPFEGVSVQDFTRRRADGEFLLHWDAHGLSYGIPTREFSGLADGRDVLFNGSRAALAAAQTIFPDILVVRITVPSRVLAARLAARGRETPEEIETRLARAAYDLPAGLTVIDVANDATPEVGVARLLAAIRKYRAVPLDRNQAHA